MKKSNILKNAVLDISALSIISIFVSCMEVIQPEEVKEIKQTESQAPSRPRAWTEPIYFFDDYTIKTALLNWLKYFSYYEKYPERYQGANLYENDEDSETVLMLAAALGDIKMMKELIHRGANVNRTSKLYHETALHYAAYKGRIKAYAFLVKNGAKQDIKSINEATLISEIKNECDGATGNKRLLKERDFNQRTPKQLLQKRISEAISGKYNED